MTEDLDAIIQAELADAVSFVESDIGVHQAAATDYYRGELFGDEEEGRSSVVSRDVADTVNQILPSLMRMFFGPEQVVEFVPQNEEDVESAEQATDYVNYIVTRDNPGFEIMYAAFKDALIRKCGVIKYWWDDSLETRTVAYSGLDDDTLTKLLEDLQGAEDAEVISSSQDDNGLSVKIKLTRKVDRARLAAVPPEEFLISRRARTVDDATLVAHRSMKTVSELVALGLDRDTVEENAQDADELASNPMTLARQAQNQSVGSRDSTVRLVLYVEAYIRHDMNDDGVAELVKVCTVGPDYKVVHKEEVDTVPFAAFHCDPEPHTFYGQSVADKVMDVQKIKSALLRNTLDNLALIINPRTVVVTNDGNMQDAMNTEIGALLRAKSPTGYVQLVTPDTTSSAYNALTYMDQVKESRTGMNRVSQGLDPAALQNTTATAASAQFTQSQQHIELIARIFAETGMTRLFRGILRLVSENQRKERMVQLRNKWTPVDPRAWRVDMDVTANVALGGGTQQEKAAVLGLILSKQEQIFATLGPQNPLVGLDEYHYALGQFIDNAGMKAVDRFFKDPKAEQPPPPPPQPNPDMIKVQLEMQKLQADQAERDRRFEMDAQVAMHAAQMAEQKLQTDAALKLADINGRNATAIDVATINAQAQSVRIGADLAIQDSEHKSALAMADKQAEIDKSKPKPKAAK